MIYDVLIIGAGPAGVTSALYLKRSGVNPLVLYKDEGALKNAHIDNYYGYTDSSGKALFEIGLKQLDNLKIEQRKEEVLSVIEKDGLFIAKTSSSLYRGKYLIIANGTNRDSLPKSFSKFLGLGVSTCALCDGPMYRNQKIWVTGTEPYLKEILSELEDFTSNITVIDYDSIKDLVGDDTLKKIVFKNNEEIETRILFVATPTSAASFSNNLGILLDGNEISVGPNMKTNIDKVYAIGDTIKGTKQVSKAVYDGTVAALSIIREIRNEKFKETERENI